MSTSWNSQQNETKYCLQFETDNKKLYKAIEKLAQAAVDAATALKDLETSIEIASGNPQEYFVEFQKTVQYHVTASSPEEAEEITIELDSSKEAEEQWATLPYENIIVEQE